MTGSEIVKSDKPVKIVTKVGIKKLNLVVAATAAAVAPVGGTALAQGSLPIFTWTGFYVGAQAGINFNNVSSSHSYQFLGYAPQSFGSSNNHEQGTVGVFFGYNQQFGRIVAGIEADINANFGSSNARLSIPALGKINGLGGVVGSVRAKSDWQGSIRGRLGFLATNRLLIYATAGVSITDFSFSGTGTTVFINPFAQDVYSTINQLSGQRTGVVLGGGIEFMINNAWRAKFEALHTIYNSKTATYVGNRGEERYTVRNKISITTVRIGVSRSFSTGGGSASLPR